MKQPTTGPPPPPQEFRPKHFPPPPAAATTTAAPTHIEFGDMPQVPIATGPAGNNGEHTPPPFKPATQGYPLQAHARPYTGPVFTPGQQPPMRGPPGPYHPQSHHGHHPHHHHQPRMRGPPRGAPGAMSAAGGYVPRGMNPRGQQHYMPPPQHLPPPGVYMGAYMQPMPPYTMHGPPPMGMPMAPPHVPHPTGPPGAAGQAAAVPPVQAREKKVLEILDPKTGKPITLKKATTTTTDASAAATEDRKTAVAPSALATAATSTKATETPAIATASPKKSVKTAPAKTESTTSAADEMKAKVMALLQRGKQEKESATKVESELKKQAPANEAPAPPSPAPAAQKSPKKAITKPNEQPESPKLLSPKATKKSVTPVSSPIRTSKTPSPKKKAKSVTPAPTSTGDATPAPEDAAKPEEPVVTEEPVNTLVQVVGGKQTYTVDALLLLRHLFTELPEELQDPESKWPSMEVISDSSARSRGGRSGGGAGWERGEKQGEKLSRQSSRGSQGGGSQWQRSQEPPKRGRSERGGRGGRGGRGAPEPLFDGPVKPLERSSNRWIPVKASSNLEAAKKKIQSIMNKMTREKFDRLASQITEINMESLEMLQSVIKIIFDKALGEPHFCDMYADLCVHLERNWKVWSFLKIVQNDDDNKFYWTTMSDSDSEVVGPFDNHAAALESAVSDEFEPIPAPPSLKLSEVRVRDGKFIKLWADESSDSQEVYWSGQLLEDLGDDQILNGPFENHELASRYAIKSCSFKRILLNACQEEFEKDNIYEELEESHKKAKEEGSLTAEAEAEYEEKRIIMKGRMLGNIRFIGELYRKGMLQERIMHECIIKLMGVKVVEGVLQPSHPENAPDEENIESLCKLLSTMGKDLEKHGQQGDAMSTYFAYLEKKLVKDKRLCSRIVFMIRDMIDLRKNRWEPRRKELQSKSLNEIRKEAEREQRAPQSAPSVGSGRSESFRMDSRRSGSSRDGGFSQRPTMAPIYQSQSMSSRSSGSSRMQLPLDRKFQRDESVKTGRPASFGAASRRSGGGSGPPASGSRKPIGANDTTGNKVATKTARPTSPESAPLSEDDKEVISKKAKSIAEEYVSIKDINEADTCFAEIMTSFKSHPQVSEVFASEVLVQAIEAKQDAQRCMFDLVEKLSVEKASLSFDGVRRGIEKLVELAADLMCDVPKLPEHFATLVVRFVKIADRSGVNLDWLMCGCGQAMESEVYDELIQGGFLSAMIGCLLASLKEIDLEKARAQVRSTYITLWSLFPEHERTPEDLQRWVEKHQLSEVVGLGHAFEFIKHWKESPGINVTAKWIAETIPQVVMKDPLFVTNVCLFVLARLSNGEMPSADESMLLTGFCHDIESQTRLLAAVIQTRSENDDIKKLLKHLLKDAAAIPANAFAKWLELKDDNSVGRKQALEELGDFVEELSRTK